MQTQQVILARTGLLTGIQPAVSASFTRPRICIAMEDRGCATGLTARGGCHADVALVILGGVVLVLRSESEGRVPGFGMV